MTVTIILPCAGNGTRLGLPFPKELAPISPGRAVIDSSLDLIAKTSIEARIILMDDGTREQTRKYIEKRLPDVPLAVVRQHRYASDMPEAIIRLEPWLGDANILMLPDAAYETDGEPLAQLADLARESGFAMAATRLPQESLKRLGAVQVAKNVVTAYEDKPELPDAYNAAWGMLAFSGKVGLMGMRVIASSTIKQHKARPPVIGAPVVWLKDYRDCGTWNRYLQEIGSRDIQHRQD